MDFQQGLQAIREAQQEEREKVAAKIAQAQDKIADKMDLMQVAYEYFGPLKPNSR